MARLFGVAGVQMEVVPWNAGATVQKMVEIINRVSETLPWVQMFVFHELVVSGVAQFVGGQTSEPWKGIAESIPATCDDSGSYHRSVDTPFLHSWRDRDHRAGHGSDECRDLEAVGARGVVVRNPR